MARRGTAASGLSAAVVLARHPLRILAIVRAWITGRRLRARQGLAALIGIDHRLALPPSILAAFPHETAQERQEHQEHQAGDSDILVLTSEGHTLVAGARRSLVATFADPTLHALYGDALIQAEPDGPVMPVLRSAFDPDYALAADAVGPVLAVRRSSLPGSAGEPSLMPPLEAALRIAERHGPESIGHLAAIVSVRTAPGEGWRDARDSLPPLRGRVPCAAGGERGGTVPEISPSVPARPAEEPESEEPYPAPSLPSPDPRLREGHPPPQGGEGRRTTQTHAAIIRAHLDRTGRADAALVPDGDGVLSVAHPLPDPLPPVSVIVPTRDRLDLLRTCLASLRRHTDWPDLEIVVADNNSREPETLAYFRQIEAEGPRVVACPGPFDFAGMNNRAAATARGRLLAFVNNDVEAFRPDWLRRMAREALRPEVGAVGAKLLDGEGRIQHGGIVLGTGGLATHAHRHFPGDAPGYGLRLLATHRVSAVTAACLVVEARKFREVGGFDAGRFAVDFNDVDLCLRLDAAGYRTLMVPGAVLHHREGASRTRSAEAQGRHEREIAALKRRWGPLLAQDPHYHPGFDPDLSTHARLRAGFPDGATAPAAVRRSAPSRSRT